jgi:cellulose synthase (UDP-forming)
MRSHGFYFDRFECRVPPEPVRHSPERQLLWQFLIVVSLVLGASYIWWRWTSSLNLDALWFALPVVIAETAAFVGLILFAINLWAVTDFPILAPPAAIDECTDGGDETGRRIAIDVMFATYNEDPELVRLGILDAKAIRYPYPVTLQIHVLDDGKRASMRAVCEEENVNYISRSTNEGFKAGNLRNALEQTSGDFIVICDADTRPFPTILERTMGYFRDPKVAWVQTPQWFFDLPEGRGLDQVLEGPLGRPGAMIGRAVQKLVGPIRFGADPFVNDPQMFYDVILRRRNWANAAFCCGAGSIHRREAIMEAALRAYGAQIERATIEVVSELTLSTHEREVSDELVQAIRNNIAVTEALTPYKFHVSEDIYTSIVLHSDRERGWKSVMHPYVESKMLSPQDLLSWTIQRFKYAGGTLDIMFHDNPLFRPGLTLPQRLMYASTFWSYMGGLWNIVFLTAPIVYLLTGFSPVRAYSTEFFLRILPFMVMLELATMVGTWGIAGYRSKASYMGFFPINLRALWAVITGTRIVFPVTPKDRLQGRQIRLVWPQLAIIVATLLAAATAVTVYSLGYGNYSAAGVLANLLWGANNILAMLVMVAAGFWQPANEDIK